jgi:hypothetical protein
MKRRHIQKTSVFRKIALLIWGLFSTRSLNYHSRRPFEFPEGPMWKEMRDFVSGGTRLFFTLHLERWISSLRKKKDVNLNLTDRQLPNRKVPVYCRCSLQGTWSCSFSCAVSAKYIPVFRQAAGAGIVHRTGLQILLLRVGPVDCQTCYAFTLSAARFTLCGNGRI